MICIPSRVVRGAVAKGQKGVTLARVRCKLLQPETN